MPYPVYHHRISVLVFFNDIQHIFLILPHDIGETIGVLPQSDIYLFTLVLDTFFQGFFEFVGFIGSLCQLADFAG